MEQAIGEVDGVCLPACAARAECIWLTTRKPGLRKRVPWVGRSSRTGVCPAVGWCRVGEATCLGWLVRQQ